MVPIVDEEAHEERMTGKFLTTDGRVVSVLRHPGQDRFLIRIGGPGRPATILKFDKWQGGAFIYFLSGGR